jgi:hypothetical protein
MILNARRIEPQGGTQRILLSVEDVTRKQEKSKDGSGRPSEKPVRDGRGVRI